MSLLRQRVLLTIRIKFKTKQEDFGIDEIYPEGQVIKMGKKAMQILNLKDEEFYEGMGVYFVELTTILGYGKTVAHLGRNLRDFLLNLDNLHDYLKFTFPRLKPPSFFVESETDSSKKIAKNILAQIITTDEQLKSLK